MQSIGRTASPGASPPRRVLRSRQGHAGVIVGMGEGGTLSTIIQGRSLDACYNVAFCKDKRCMTCKTLINPIQDGRFDGRSKDGGVKNTPPLKIALPVAPEGRHLKHILISLYH